MGMFDWYAGVQVKAPLTPRELHNYEIGDSVPVCDGLYLGWEGWFLVKDGVLREAATTVLDKWGRRVSANELLSAYVFSEMKKAFPAHVHTHRVRLACYQRSLNTLWRNRK